MFTERTLVARVFPVSPPNMEISSRQSGAGSLFDVSVREHRNPLSRSGRGRLLQYSCAFSPTFQKHASMSREPHVKCFLFRKIILFSFNSFRGLALLSPCEPTFVTRKSLPRFPEHTPCLSSWSVHRLNLRSVVYGFLTRDVTSFYL